MPRLFLKGKILRVLLTFATLFLKEVLMVPPAGKTVWLFCFSFTCKGKDRSSTENMYITQSINQTFSPTQFCVLF